MTSPTLEYVLRSKFVLLVTVTLVVAWVVLFVCAIRYHPSVWTLGFHAANVAFILWRVWLRYRSRHRQ